MIAEIKAGNNRALSYEIRPDEVADLLKQLQHQANMHTQAIEFTIVQRPQNDEVARALKAFASKPEVAK